jgi:hypothetical protein
MLKNHGHTELFPVASKYWTPKLGVRTKSKIFMMTHMKHQLGYQQFKKNLENSLSIVNVSSYSRDNANVNFAKHNLVFQKLKLDPNIQLAKCLSQVLPKCIKQAGDK